MRERASAACSAARTALWQRCAIDRSTPIRPALQCSRALARLRCSAAVRTPALQRNAGRPTAADRSIDKCKQSKAVHRARFVPKGSRQAGGQALRLIGACVNACVGSACASACVRGVLANKREGWERRRGLRTRRGAAAAQPLRDAIPAASRAMVCSLTHTVGARGSGIGWEWVGIGACIR